VSHAVEGPVVAFAGACFFEKTKGIVISTEAAHSLIVSSVAEKSASLSFPVSLPVILDRAFQKCEKITQQPSRSNILLTISNFQGHT
jgi:hypothetical protein